MVLLFLCPCVLVRFCELAMHARSQNSYEGGGRSDKGCSRIGRDIFNCFFYKRVTSFEKDEVKCIEVIAKFDFERLDFIISCILNSIKNNLLI